ncbi:MAG: hypothetical protein U9O94_04915 [Nanoarchaeota archaeon]|nr:hypothetical protein [Nanoarchaeota archaeon]
MAYKIKWRSGGETAERYSSKALAQAILKQANLSGSIIKAPLTNPGRTNAYVRMAYGGRLQKYPSGRKLVWKGSKVKVRGVVGTIYRTEVINR